MFFDMEQQQSRVKQLAKEIIDFKKTNPNLEIENVDVEQCVNDLCVGMFVNGTRVIFGMEDDGHGGYRQTRLHVGDMNFKSDKYINGDVLDFNTCKDALFSAIRQTPSINNNSEISLETAAKIIKMSPYSTVGY